MFTLLFALASLVPIRSIPPAPDRIVLENGKSIDCRVLMESAEKIVYREDRKQHEVLRADVREVRSIERSLADYLKVAASTKSTDAAAQADLAQHAERLGLPDEARNAWLRVLSIDPANGDAWTVLGAVGDRKARTLQLEGERLELDALRTRGADAKHPLQLRTTHFAIECDMPLERALDAALAVERTYLAFYGLMGAHLELYVFDEVPHISVFKDTRRLSAPPTPGMQSWFAPIANTLYVQDLPTADVRTILADMTDVMLFNAYCRSADKKRNGVLEGWARAGLGQSFGTAVRNDPAHSIFDFAAPYKPHFETQAKNAKEMTLERVLRAGHATFQGGPEREQFEAAAYTLWHYLMFGDGGKHAAALSAYIEDVYFGRGGPTRFEALMGMDFAHLEVEWNAHVHEIAGI